MPSPPPDPADLLKQVNQLRTSLRRADVELAQKGTEIQRLEDALAQSNAKVSKLEAQLADLAKSSEELQAPRVPAASRPRIRVDALTRQFRQAIEAVNLESAATAVQAGHRAFVVEQLDVEFRGGIDVADGLQLTQLEGGELSAQSASTIRLVMRPAAQLRIAED